MISRRCILAGVLAIPFAGHLNAATDAITLEELKAEFMSRDINNRKMVQNSLHIAGLYNRGIDGAWGQGMEDAYRQLMASKKYREVSQNWQWPRHVQIVETLMFFTSDAYMD